MSKKAVKLALAFCLLAGSVALGLPKPAQALGFCQDICCDPGCFSVRHCSGDGGGGCICQEFCIVN